METLQLVYRQSRHPRQDWFIIQRIISALEAIGRPGLARKISAIVARHNADNEQLPSFS